MTIYSCKTARRKAVFMGGIDDLLSFSNLLCYGMHHTVWHRLPSETQYLVSIVHWRRYILMAQGLPA